tara:strand:- start:2392 stop:3729 length:1338 start_codon:yes stop_codon:yes gene_type:complete
MNEYKNNIEINVYGAGLYGILLSYKLSKLEIVKQFNIKIKLIEKTDNILQGWDYIELNKIKFNNGFHSIEMPRAEQTYQELSQLINEDIFFKKDVLRLISINGFTTKLGTSIKKWPNLVSAGLKDLLNKMDEVVHYDIERNLKDEIKNYALGKIISNCVTRYSNTLNETWSEFYPYFFPKEFIKNSDKDEGSKFRFKIMEGKIKPYYLEPKNSLFFNLKSKIEENLKKHNIELKKNINLKDGSLTINNQNETNFVYKIWASSSSHILKKYSDIEEKELVTSSNNLIIAVFSIENSFINKWRKKYDARPSEILCLSEDIPSLSRISFPSSIDKKYPNKSFIYCELYSKSNFLSNNQIKKCTSFLSNIFENNINYENSILGRKTYYLNHDNLNNLEKKVLVISEKLNLKVPYIYWGPVNMAKCGIEAEESSIKINEELKNILKKYSC